MAERTKSKLEQRMDKLTPEERKREAFKRMWHQDITRVDTLKENSIRTVKSVAFQTKQHYNNRKLLETLGLYDEFLEYGKEKGYFSHTNRVMDDFLAMHEVGRTIEGDYRSLFQKLEDVVGKRYNEGMSLPELIELVERDSFLTKPQECKAVAEVINRLPLTSMTVKQGNGHTMELVLGTMFFGHKFEQMEITEIVREVENGEVYYKVYVHSPVKESDILYASYTEGEIDNFVPDEKLSDIIKKQASQYNYNNK